MFASVEVKGNISMQVFVFSGNISVCKCGKECMQVFGGNISVCKCGKECMQVFGVI